MTARAHPAQQAEGSHAAEARSAMIGAQVRAVQDDA